jgi:archaellum component FlaC
MEKNLKQYLDKRFDRVDQKFDSVDQRFNGIGRELIGMKQRFDQLEQKIDTKIDDAIESLARIIATTVTEPLERHMEETRDYPTVRKDVSILKHDVSVIKRTLNIKT